ncbi:chemotaxis protein MotB [Neokomagataea thailandica NBRC 106555]|uniref:Chemotaxis protein MotB n=2 Tax=Neokomagataea TaxID=1223423 RepID=A0A4Y6V1W4_9PROT|nr:MULTISPECIES: flagellar motor protein MotB [Neokomagataea]QDH24019.1 chemotaxis protein MotB [Neokomagataea tanensis]GBR52301.1 chemotaxis protein MotB [Neokomagataea thailandica NBRC 106555]
MPTSSPTEKRSIIIKRYNVVEAGHHGGAWKIAYADFVTAMMAFFLVMWLINATTEEQRRGIASYFNPMAIQKDVPPPVDNMLGTDASPLATTAQAVVVHEGEFSGHKADNGRGAVTAHATDQSTQIVPLHDRPAQPGETAPTPRGTQKAHQAAVMREIQAAIGANAALHTLRDQVSITQGDDGLHIQIADSEKESMFALGAVEPTEHAKALLVTIAPYLARMAGAVSVAGYTDAAPFHSGSLSNWQLSGGRAAAARDILVHAGLPDWRFHQISGYADRDLAEPAHPLAAVNRRVVLVVASY